MSDKYVDDLMNRGFTIVPSNHHGMSAGHIEDAHKAGQQLLQVMRESDLDFGFVRPGEGRDKDIGLVRRKKSEGKDEKFFLHHTHELWPILRRLPKQRQVLRGSEDQLALQVQLYDRLRIFIGTVLQGVEDQLGNRLHRNCRSLASLFDHCCKISMRFSVSVLRSLWYEAIVGQTGAQGHLDRCLITAWMIGHGGQLRGHTEYGLGGSFELDPRPGDILLFWGVRAPIVSNGILMPLYHSAPISPGEERQVLTYFGNVPWPQIQEWEKGVEMLCQKQRINDFGPMYEQFWKR